MVDVISRDQWGSARISIGTYSVTIKKKLIKTGLSYGQIIKGLSVALQMLITCKCKCLMMLCINYVTLHNHRKKHNVFNNCT